MEGKHPTRVPCPFCGERDPSEFAYLGDAEFKRAEPGAPDALARYFEAVYLRDNPAGPHNELWFHTSGCRTWLRVTRDTLTCKILDVQFARGELRAVEPSSIPLRATGT